MIDGLARTGPLRLGRAGTVCTWLVCLLTVSAAQRPQAAHAAAPTVTRLAPAGAQIGTQQTIQITGKLPDDAQVWCSDRLLQCQLNRSEARLTIDVPQSTAPGVRFLRFYNAEGSTAPIPFVLSRLPQTVEVEPNNDLQEATDLAVDRVATGVLEKSGDVDTYRLQPVAGSDLVIDVDAAHSLGSPMDAVVQLVSARGFVLVQEDDTVGTDPRLVWSPTSDEPVYVRVFAFPATPNSTIGFAGGADFVYRLTATQQPFVAYSEPVLLTRSETQPDLPVSAAAQGWNLDQLASSAELVGTPAEGVVNLTSAAVVNHFLAAIVPMPIIHEQPSAAAPQPLAHPVAVNGSLDQPGEVDAYRLSLKKGDSIQLWCRALEFDSRADPLLEIFGPDGKSLKTADDIDRAQRDARLDFKAPVDGDYRLQVSERFGGGGSGYFYALQAAVLEPDFELTVDSHTLTIPKGKPLELKVNVIRQGGFNQPVTVTAVELPEGVICEAVTADAKAKTVTLKLAAAAAWQGVLQVTGSSDGDVKRQHFATTALPGRRQQSRELWLTAIAP